MPHREFTDESGRRWEAWEVHPSSASAQRSAARGPAIAPALQRGWLAFRCETERRRIVPPPPGWEALGEESLRMLLRQAQVIAPVRRLIE